MSLAQRAISERVNLAIHDPEGEREARTPVPGSLAYWENELARPLKGSVVMDEQTAQRIATALEQIALELGERNAAKVHVQERQDQVAAALQQNATYGSATATPHAQFVGNAALGVPQLLPPQCPVHGKPWRSGTYGAYCPTKMLDGSWCKQKPVVAGVGVLP